MGREQGKGKGGWENGVEGEEEESSGEKRGREKKRVGRE